MSARFRFRVEGFQVEFEGSENFVAEQIALARGRILGALGGGGAPAPAAPGSPKAADGGLEAFYLEAKAREGRGALQDSILIFAYYLQKEQGKHEFSIEDLNFCFDYLDQERPKSLANTLGVLKRDRRLLHAGSRRGTYTLAEKGLEKVRALL